MLIWFFWSSDVFVFSREWVWSLPCAWGPKQARVWRWNGPNVILNDPFLAAILPSELTLLPPRWLGSSWVTTLCRPAALVKFYATFHETCESACSNTSYYHWLSCLHASLHRQEQISNPSSLRKKQNSVSLKHTNGLKGALVNLQLLPDRLGSGRGTRVLALCWSWCCKCCG